MCGGPFHPFLFRLLASKLGSNRLDPFFPWNLRATHSSDPSDRGIPPWKDVSLEGLQQDLCQHDEGRPRSATKGHLSLDGAERYAKFFAKLSNMPPRTNCVSHHDGDSFPSARFSTDGIFQRFILFHFGVENEIFQFHVGATRSVYRTR